MAPELVLALDIGTSSVRAAVYDAAGDVLPATMVKNERLIRTTDDGGAEIDADEAVAQVFAAIDEALGRSEDLIERIGYAAMSCFWHSLVGADDAGRATTPVFTWAEKRPAEYVQRLRDELDESATHNRTGARFHASFWPAKLIWLREEFPDAFARTSRWLSFSDYLALKLFGEDATSVSMASGTGLFDVRRNDWDAPLLEHLGIDRKQLPRIAADGETFSTAAGDRSGEQPRLRRRLEHVSWFPAIGDGAANNLGAGCANASKAALMIGTSGAMRVAFAGDVPARIPAGLWCYRIDRRRVIAGGALSDGGGLYRWLKDNFRLRDDDDRTEEEIAERAPAAHGLTFLPFLAGERSTGYHERAEGAILGIKSATDKIDIVQAALESVAYRFAEIHDQLAEICPLREIIASGGALRESPVWTQIIADVLGRDLSLPDTREASSRGAVLLALATVGKIENIDDLPTPPGDRFKFDEDRHEIYRNARARHAKFYNLLIENKHL